MELIGEFNLHSSSDFWKENFTELQTNLKGNTTYSVQGTLVTEVDVAPWGPIVTFTTEESGECN